MKAQIKYLLVFALFAILSLTACQDEVTEVINPNEQETITPNSTLANLMSYTSANFGAVDDILDGTSCFSVELPVTIIVSDITIVIETEADLEQLEDLFEDLNSNEDFLDFIFPITIIFSDYTELVIENADQLENFINECEEDDNVIECVDLVYPISFSVFDSEFSLIDTVTIENDEALYEFLEGLEDNDNALIVSLNYPVTLEFSNNETLEVNSNEELAETIASAEDDCEDDNEDDCEEEEIALNLIECQWEVYLYTNDDLENLDGPYTFIFNDNGNVIIEGLNQDPQTTTWELLETDNGLELSIASFYYYEEQFGNWLVVQCDDDELKFEHLTVDGSGLFFEQECEDDLDCSLLDISDILQECPWDFSDGTDLFDNYQMIFNANGELLITEGGATSAIGGNWSLSISNNGLPEISISNLTAFQDYLGGDWLIVECDEDRLQILRLDYTIVLEQNCEANLGCTTEQIGANIVECAWELETNLIDSFVPIYVYFAPNGQVYTSNNDDPENQIGTWEMVTVASDIFIEFTFQQGLDVLTDQWQVVECTEGELYLVNGDNYILLSQECDLNEYNCDYEVVEINLKECVWNVVNLNGSNDLIEYDFDFTENYNVNISQNNEVINDGSWSVSETDQGLLLNLELQFENLIGSWLIVECEDDRLELVRGDDIIVLERDCTVDTNPFNCFNDFELVECVDPNGEAEFNLSADTIGLIDCPFNFTASFHVTEVDADNDTNAISNTESYFSVTGQVYLRIVADNGNFEIYTIYLNTEECDLFECFASFDAVIELCDEGNDGFETFNLTNAFANCTTSVDVVTYYETQADAEVGTNPIANPEAYTNIAVEQQVYVSVEIGNQLEVFPILLLLEDCNQGDCTEEDVDAFLLECIWNAVNYNGSDNLAEYNFDFESSNQTVVIYTNEITIDAIWSTSQTSAGVIVEFSNVAGPNIQAITGEWLIVECEEARLELHRGDDILVLERNCD